MRTGYIQRTDATDDCGMAPTFRPGSLKLWPVHGPLFRNPFQTPSRRGFCPFPFPFSKALSNPSNSRQTHQTQSGQTQYLTTRH